MHKRQTADGREVNFFFAIREFAAILLHLTYCHLTWHFCNASNRRKLERIQERGLRAVSKDKHSCYEKLLAKADIPSLYNRRLQDIAIFMYKIKNNLLPQGLCNGFLLDHGSYNIRKREFVIPQFSSATYGKHSLCYLGPKLWNDLAYRIDPSMVSDAILVGRKTQHNLQ